MSDREDRDLDELPEGEQRSKGKSRPKKITFDDFQIQRNAQQRQIDDEKRAILEREQRLQDQKPGFLKFAVPRLRSIREDMIGGGKKLSSMFFGGGRSNTPEDADQFYDSDNPQAFVNAAPFEDEKLSVRVRHQSDERSGAELPSKTLSNEPQSQRIIRDPDADRAEEEYAQLQDLEEELEEELEEDLDDAFEGEEEQDDGEELGSGESNDNFESDNFDDELDPAQENEEKFEREEEEEELRAAPTGNFELPNDEPQIEEALLVYLDALRSFDSTPRRAHAQRDPRADFVSLLSEQLDILRDQLDAMSALFFWVNNRKQQLVLECGSLEDRAHMYLTREKKFPIELDAVSMVVSRKKPELHSTITSLSEHDLIPYYVEPIGVASFAAMPVLFGEGLVGVITVDSDRAEQFSAETLRILTSHAKLIAGLIKSYIEQYDLLAAARTLESARKLYQLVSPDAQTRALRDNRRGAEWILRALTEAISEIVDWEWLAAISFDEARRVWSVTSLQSKQTNPYITPQTQIDLNESIVGKCITSGKHARYEYLTSQQLRFSVEEDRSAAVGHSFLTIPIRTHSKNYGALAIEHSDRARFTEADVETLEHLARSAASALEITALSEIVEERALTDLLTGSLNKRGFIQRINEELARAMEFDEPLTLVLFEIDAAAEFFARFSQEDADTIVLKVTRLLRYGARPFDVIARVGEHAFAAILIKMPDEEGYLWSEKMRKMIVSEVIAIGKRSFSVTASAGVSGARRDATIEELIEGAELAVERAKELGGNNVIVY